MDVMKLMMILLVISDGYNEVHDNDMKIKKFQLVSIMDVMKLVLMLVMDVMKLTTIL